MAKIGDYVTAKLLNEADCRQGVLIASTPTRSIVFGEQDVYICEPKGHVVVADSNILLPSTVAHIADVRAGL